jgi:hypothetical protein
MLFSPFASSVTGRGQGPYQEIFMGDSTEFQLSRIYASGWSAGRSCSVDDPAEIDLMESNLNPHLSADERERWSQGFKAAVLRHMGSPAKFRSRSSRMGA